MPHCTRPTPLCAVSGYEALDGVLDGVFLFDILFIKLHTTYPYMGELVQERSLVMRHYLRGWFKADFVSALPVAAFVLSIAKASHASSATVEGLQWLRLPRLLRLSRVRRRVQAMTNANVVRVSQLLLFFLMFAHWLGQPPRRAHAQAHCCPVPRRAASCSTTCM